MPTLPTRQQRQAFERLSQAMFLIAQAHHLDGRGRLDPDTFHELSNGIAAVSSTFPPEEIIADALGRKAAELGLRPGTVDLLLLWDGARRPTDMLLMGDEAFRELAQRLEAELGEV